MNKLEEIRKIANSITMKCVNILFNLHVEYDMKYQRVLPNGDIDARIFLQVSYLAPCTNTGKLELWKGRKYYLSDYMTEDEIVKTAYVAFEQAVKHEVMEGFKKNGVIVFNPHVNHEELIKVSHLEVRREETRLKLVE